MSSNESSSPSSFPFEDYQVPDEPGIWFCPRHKSVKTRLRCGRCEKPICPKCTVMAPTGARCGDCASNRYSHIYQLGARHYILAFVASLAVGALGAFITQLAGALWLWVLLYAPLVGPLWSRIIARVTRGKRGLPLVFTVSAGIVVGGLTTALGFAFALSSSINVDGVPGYLAPTGSALVLGATLLNLPLVAFLIVAILGVWWSLK